MGAAYVTAAVTVYTSSCNTIATNKNGDSILL